MDNSNTGPVLNPRSLGSSFAWLLLSLLATGALVAFVLFYSGQVELARKQAQAQQAESRARMARANEDEQEIRAKIARYQSLVAAGRSAPERRLDWVETLRHSKESRRLLGLEYEISPQRPLDPKLVGTGGYDFLASPMRLDLPLLHEYDLLGLLADLSAHSQALVSVKRCAIERLPRDAARQGAAQLRANCDLDWITLQEKL